MLQCSTSLSQNSPKFCVSLLVTLPVQAAHQADQAWYPTVSIANLSGGWLFFATTAIDILHCTHIFLNKNNAFVICKKCICALQNNIWSIQKTFPIFCLTTLHCSIVRISIPLLIFLLLVFLPVASNHIAWGRYTSLLDLPASFEAGFFLPCQYSLCFLCIADMTKVHFYSQKSYLHTLYAERLPNLLHTGASRFRAVYVSQYKSLSPPREATSLLDLPASYEAGFFFS